MYICVLYVHTCIGAPSVAPEHLYSTLHIHILEANVAADRHNGNFRTETSQRRSQKTTPPSLSRREIKRGNREHGASHTHPTAIENQPTTCITTPKTDKNIKKCGAPRAAARQNLNKKPGSKLRPNPLPHQWRRKLKPGGSPGTVTIKSTSALRRAFGGGNEHLRSPASTTRFINSLYTYYANYLASCTGPTKEVSYVRGSDQAKKNPPPSLSPPLPSSLSALVPKTTSLTRHDTHNLLS